ncbi:MAG TPA: DUF4479 domain-containing protein [Bacillota bacterium]|nr:DUF4479 domain-containing protein [Bacillota bacterium]
MDVFYNPHGIGDVLIIPIEEDEHGEWKQEAVGDIIRITDQKGNLLGINIFNAASYFDLHRTGKITLTEELLKQMKALFQEHGLTDPLDFDLSPKFVVGYAQEKQFHENADKLTVCQVDVGDETLQIVCGAPNVEQGQKVVVAKVGATMPSGMKIKQTKLRGVSSYGMICSKRELGLPQAPEEKGIYVLDDDYEVGHPFEF